MMASIVKNIVSGAFRRYPRICKLKELEKQTKLFSTKLSAKKEPEEVLTDNKLQKNSLAVEDYFQVGRLFTISDLFEARVHYGHKIGSMNDYMKPYIFGERLGHLIIDLDITACLLKQALNFIAHIAYRDGIILFVSQTPQHTFLIEKVAIECDQFAQTRRWRVGMFTNSTMMFGAITRLPDLCIVLNTLTNVLDQHPIINEAAKMAIPVVGIVDTNCNPNLITYPIPGNDDSPASIEFYCNLFKTVILRAKEYRDRDFKKE